MILEKVKLVDFKVLSPPYENDPYAWDTHFTTKAGGPSAWALLLTLAALIGWYQADGFLHKGGHVFAPLFPLVQFSGGAQVLMSVIQMTRIH